jgi:hypothetical protein
LGKYWVIYEQILRSVCFAYFSDFKGSYLIGINVEFKVLKCKELKVVSQYMFHSGLSSCRSILYADLLGLFALCRPIHILSCDYNETEKSLHSLVR